MAAKKRQPRRLPFLNTQDQILALETELDTLVGTVNELGKKVRDSKLSTRAQNTARKKYYECTVRQSEIEREIAQLKENSKRG